MKKILIVDDDNYKTSNIVQLLNKMNIEPEITIEKALNPGLRKICQENFDIVILDMSMPIFDLSESSNFNSFGGITFLEEMKRKKISIPTIIVTQYQIFGEGSSQKTSDSIDKMCQENFQNYKGLIIYSSLESNWKEKLVKIIGESKK